MIKRSLKQHEMTNLLLEVVPAVLVSMLTISLITYQAGWGVSTMNDKEAVKSYQEWAMAIINLYVGKSIAQESYRRANDIHIDQQAVRDHGITETRTRYSNQQRDRDDTTQQGGTSREVLPPTRGKPRRKGTD